MLYVQALHFENEGWKTVPFLCWFVGCALSGKKHITALDVIVTLVKMGSISNYSMARDSVCQKRCIRSLRKK